MRYCEYFIYIREHEFSSPITRIATVDLVYLLCLTIRDKCQVKE